MNLFDILVLGLVILGALQGYRKGLISGLISFVGSILGFFVAVKEYLTVLGWLNSHTPLRQWVESNVYQFVLPSVQSQAQLAKQQTLDRILSFLPKELLGLLKPGTVPDFTFYTQNVIQSIAKNVSAMLTENLMRLIAFLITYALIIFLLQMVVSLILSPMSFFIGPINRSGGFILGALGVLVGVSVFVGLLSPYLSFLGPNSHLSLISEARFYPYLLKIFTVLKDAFHFELMQGLSFPLDFSRGMIN